MNTEKSEMNSAYEWAIKMQQLMYTVNKKSGRTKVNRQY